MFDGIDENVKKILKVSNALLNYPNLYKHPKMLYDANKDYEAIKAKNGELEQQYSLLPYELGDQSKSDVRHPYTNAKFVRKYPEEFVRDLGRFKEDVDQIDKKPLWDTQEDLQNNEFGIQLGKEYINAPDVILFDKVLEHSNLPIPLRNNTLYGYITND